MENDWDSSDFLDDPRTLFATLKYAAEEIIEIKMHDEIS